MDGNTTLRVYNRCKYDIGVILLSGRDVNISAGNFIRMSVDDIMHIEGLCRNRKFFSAKMLVPVDNNGKELTLEDIDGYTDTYTEENQHHYSEEELEKELRKPFKSFEAFIKKVEDPSELDAVIRVAKKMDLPQSKMKVLQARVPGRDLLDEDDGE